MTDTPNLALAPGCFGLAMTYEEAARECMACPFASACKPLAEANLVTLRAELGIEAAKPKATIKEKPAAVAVVNPTVLVDGPTPKKVITHIERLDRLRIAITPALARGENPFKPSHKQTFLRIACHLLLKVRAGITRDFLVQCFVQKLGHSQKTAESHALQAVQILTAVGAAHETNGLFQLKGNGQ
jgi:hypothetical protein